MRVSLLRRDGLVMEHRARAERMAWGIAKRYGVLWGIADIRSAACLGLVEAATNYQDVGVKFSSFSGKRIVGQIIDEICFLRNVKRKVKDGARIVGMEVIRDDGSGDTIDIQDLVSDDGGIERAETRVDFFRGTQRAGLDRKEETFINLCWFSGYTLLRAAGAMGYTESRVSQIRKSTIRKLEKYLGRRIDDSGVLRGKEGRP